MVPKRLELRLLLALSDRPTRRRVVNVLVELANDGQLNFPGCRLKIVRCSTPEETFAKVRYYRTSPAQPSVIVLSDCLVESTRSALDTDTWIPSHCAKEICDELDGRGVVIALMEKPRRVRDIDRALNCAPSKSELLAALRLMVEKLRYMAPPPHRQPAEPVVVRLIRRQHELLEYFKLRHRIYRIMGYLEEAIENAPSQLEIDWCDSISLHVGAFEQLTSARERLVGTARVVVGSASSEHRMPKLLEDYRRWVERLAEPDPVLRRMLTERVLELELPIFHAQNLSDVFRGALLRDEICGELSRVIVAEDHRGTGLSRRLVEMALSEASRAGVERMFLECLELHEGMYRKFGFRRLEGKRGAVLSVNTTMIPMELYPLPGSRSGSSRARRTVTGERADV